MSKFLNKKVFIISLIVLTIFILAGLVFYFLNQKQKAQISPKTQEETLAEKQLKELDELRQRAETRSLTEKEKQAQIKELGTLRKQSGGKPLSQEQIQKQLEELNKLRLSQ